MQTYKIDDRMRDFNALKAQLDAKAALYRTEKKLHMTGTVKHWQSRLVAYTEYIYSFSTEDTKE